MTQSERGMESARRTSAPRTRDSKNRWAIEATVLGAVLAALLVVLVPLGTGAAAEGQLVTAATVTIKAPYSGGPQQAAEWLSDGTCGVKSSFPTSPTFNMTSGTFHGSANATATSCGKFNDTMEAGVFGGLGADSLVKMTTTTGKHTVRFYWTIVYTVTLTAHLGSKAIAEAESVLTLYAEVSDVANGSSFFPTSSWTVTNTSLTGTYTHQVTEHAVIAVTGSFVAGHTYALISYVTGFAVSLVTVANGGTAATAWANLNIGTAGNHATMTSITVT